MKRSSSGHNNKRTRDTSSSPTHITTTTATTAATDDSAAEAAAVNIIASAVAMATATTTDEAIITSTSPRLSKKTKVATAAEVSTTTAPSLEINQNRMDMHSHNRVIKVKLEPDGILATPPPRPPTEMIAVAGREESSPPTNEETVIAVAPPSMRVAVSSPSIAATIPPAESSTASLRNQNQNMEELIANFDHNLFHLLDFKVKSGHFHVPKGHYLHAWLQFLKKEYKIFNINLNNPSSSSSSSSIARLSETQVKVLEHLHVPLTSRGDEHWNRFFALLNAYQTRHGHVMVPRLCEVPGLGDWVTDQRRQYKAWKQGRVSQLTDDRRHKLDALNFTWQVRVRPKWDMQYQQLVEYQEKHGDCKVPQNYRNDKALGKWVAKQREQLKLMKKKKHSFLTPYRIEKLNEIGFAWEIRSHSLDEEKNNDDEDIRDNEGAAVADSITQEEVFHDDHNPSEPQPQPSTSVESNIDMV